MAGKINITNSEVGSITGNILIDGEINVDRKKIKTIKLTVGKGQQFETLHAALKAIPANSIDNYVIECMGDEDGVPIKINRSEIAIISAEGKMWHTK